MRTKSAGLVGLRCGFQMYGYITAQQRLRHVEAVILQIVYDLSRPRQYSTPEIRRLYERDLAIYVRYGRLLRHARRIYPMHN